MDVLQRLGTCVVIVVPPNMEMKQRFNVQASSFDQCRDWTMRLGQEGPRIVAWLDTFPQYLIPDDRRTHTTQSLLPVTVPLYYVSGLPTYAYSFDRTRSWLLDYLFSSAVRAASSSLVCNVIVNACSGRRGPGTYSRRAGVGQSLTVRNERPAGLESLELRLGGEACPGLGSFKIAGIVGFLNAQHDG